MLWGLWLRLHLLHLLRLLRLPERIPPSESTLLRNSISRSQWLNKNLVRLLINSYYLQKISLIIIRISERHSIKYLLIFFQESMFELLVKMAQEKVL